MKNGTRDTLQDVSDVSYSFFTVVLAVLGAIVLTCMVIAPSIAYAIEYHSDTSDQLNATALHPLEDYIQTVYDDKDGLPGGTVNDIAQTKNGALWIGTYSGLYRFNGHSLESVDANGAIKNVNCLFVDSDNRLWVGTNDSGLIVLKDGCVIATLKEEAGLPSNSVRSITCDSKGNYYVGTTDALAVVTMSAGAIKLIDTINETSFVNSLAVNTEDTVAATTGSGACYLLKNGQIITQIPSPIENEYFTCTAFGADGRLFAAVGANIVLYSLEGTGAIELQRIECTGLNDIMSLYVSPRNRLIICGYNGAAYLDAQTRYFPLDTGTFTSNIGHALVDYQGNVWLTSTRQGLLKLSVSPFTEVYSHAGLTPKVVNAIVNWKGSFYIGTDQGIDVLNADLEAQSLPEWAQSFNTVRIRSVAVDSHDNLWVCTSGEGAWRITPSGEKLAFTNANGATGMLSRSILELADGTIALASENGISFIQNNTVVGTLTSATGLENPKILTMAQMPDGTLLAGSDGNGIAVIKNGKIEQTLKEDAGLTSKIVLRIVPDTKGNGYFIVTSNGLCYMRSDLSIRSLGNMPYSNNYDVVLGPDNQVFVTGSAGVCVMDHDQLIEGGHLNYTLLNRETGLRTGLTVNSWNYLASNNDLYLAGDNGVSKLNLIDFDEAPITYLINVRHIKANGGDFNPNEDKNITLSRDSQRIAISPEVMNYTSNDPYVSVQLEGFDSEPNIVLLSELSDSVYTNLPPGDYTYRISVLDANKNTLTSTAYSFNKAKVLHDEPWFFPLVLVLFAGLVGVIVWFIVRLRMQIKLAEQKRELEIARKQIEMANQAILTIARTVDAKDANTSEHSFRVSEYSTMIARRLGLDGDEVEEVRRTALLHDIGKVGIPDSILNKPGRLTDEEYGVMKTHPELGGKILSKFTSVDHIIDGALYHHERWDGKGYPEGLKGNEIPIMARIIGTADAFDAMTANRVYRKKLAMEDVLAELKRCRGSQFDPQMLDILLELIEDGTINVEEMFAESKANPEDRVTI